jgi:predicted MPP superfamily phosphohydrolase
VLGNHDGWYDAPRVRRALEGRGIRVLENESARLVWRGAPVWIAGLADLWTGQPDLAAALREVPGDAPVLLMTHSPDVFPGVPRRVALTLAGHTHGGQVRLPLLGRPVVPSDYGQRYAAGEVVEGGRHLFVTTGLGTSIIPVRFGVPPQIAVLTLNAAPP